jgi:hypothetical protein
MKGRSTQAGGCLLSLCILAGFAFGAMNGEAANGAVLGTAVGALVALLIWLVDRRRS